MPDDIKQNPEAEEQEEENEIVELTDEEGVTSKFEYLTTIEHEDELYVVLMLLTDDEETPEDDDGEVIILKIEKDKETDEDIYVSVDDDKVSEAVFNKFVAMMDEEEDE